jgi:hypothetical protein
MEFGISDIAQVIQIVVAPIFMLTGISGFLNVMSGRLGRIVDRARIMEKRLNVLQKPDLIEVSEKELRTLWRRIKLINWSIGLCTASALFVCAVVVGLFVGDFWKANFDIIIVTFFVIAMLLLIFALLMFLKEVQLATRTLKMGNEVFDE